jgi:ABC-type nitrate/sulfonate/bicarbonate transport system substrate-binding protein
VGEPSPSVAPPPATHVTVAYPNRVVSMTGFYVAIQEGYTHEHGLDAEMVQMLGTPSAQAMIARQVDFGMSVGALLSARLRGAPFRIVFVQIDRPLYSLLAQPDITGIAELAGKPVGISGLGDSTHAAAVAALAAHGVRADQVTFIANTGGQVAAALQSGSVAAAIAAPPTDAAVERLGFRNIGYLAEYLDNLTAGLGTHEELIRDRPAVVRAAVTAELKAHRYMQQNREGTIAHMMRYQDIGLEEATAAYDRHLKYLTADGLSTPERLERILVNQREELGIDHTMATEDAFDLRFAREAADALNRAGWRP